jgi:hypothetical protein
MEPKMKTQIEQRMGEMMIPIDSAIHLADNHNDMLMLACAMMQRTREIFDATIGEDARKIMFKELAE